MAQKTDVPIPTADQLALPLTKGLKMIGVGLSYGYELMKEGRLKTFKIGRRRMVTRESLQAFVASCEAQAGRKKAA